MSDVVTGEAVVLELRLAKLPTRALSFAIDLAVMLAGLFAVLALLGAAGRVMAPTLVGVLGLVLVVAVFVGYPVTIETLTRGRSVGKLALGLRAVRDDGGPIRFRHALARGLAGLVVDFGIVSLFTGAVAVISSLASVRGKRVGDHLAGTVVLREHAPVDQPPALGMPPPLASWAPDLELSRLPDDLALSARQFLARAPQLDPQVRVEMGERLAAEVFARVGPPPPPATPPEPYLAAVLAERSRREAARLESPAAGPGTDAAPSPSIAGPQQNRGEWPSSPGGFVPPS